MYININIAYDALTKNMGNKSYKTVWISAAKQKYHSQKQKNY